LNIYGVSDVKQTEIQTAEQLGPETSGFEVENANEKLNRHTSQDTDQHPAELIEAGSSAISSKIINVTFIWSKEELPEKWKNSIIITIYKKGDKTECDTYKGISLCQIRTKFYRKSCCQG
jgi:hypothetical protein